MINYLSTINYRQIIPVIIIVLSMNQLSAQWVQTNGPYGGNISAITSNGSNTYAGTFGGGGIWISTNNGANWESIGMTGSDITDILSIGDSIWAGTFSDGIFFSENNGEDWIEIKNGLSEYMINSLTTSDHNIYAGTRNGIYKSGDYGKNWEKVNSPFQNDFISKIAVDSSYIYAGTPVALYYSSNYGQSWSQVDNGPVNTYIQALVEVEGIVVAGTPTGLFRSSDKGVSWEQVCQPDIGYRSLAVYGNKIVTGMGSSAYPDPSHGIYQSVDNGLNWSQIGSINSAISNLALSESNVYASVQGGLWVHDYISWYLSNEGIINSSIYAVAATESKLFASSLQGLFTSTNQGLSWELDKSVTHIVLNILAKGDSIYLCKSSGLMLSDNNGISWKNIGLSHLRIESVYLSENLIFAGTNDGIYYSGDGGLIWNQAGLGNKYIQKLLILDQHIFAAVRNDGLYKSNDIGNFWEKCSFDEKLIRSLAASGTTIYAGTSNGLYHSTDYGSSWELTSSSLPSTNISSIVLYENRMFLGANDGYSNVTGSETLSGSYFTTDGIRWGILNDGLMTKNISSLAIFNNMVIAGTSGAGVWHRPISDFFIPLSLPDKVELVSPRQYESNLSTEIQLLWLNDGSADNYCLQVDDDVEFASNIENDSTVVDTFKVIGGLIEGHRYYWRVAAENSVGKGPWSDVWNFTTILPAPSNLSLNRSGLNEVTLRWSENSTATEGYIIERKNNLQQEFEILDSLKYKDSTYTDNNVVQGENYTYRVRAYTKFTESDYSNVISILVVGVDENELPREYSLSQNYPNPFNPKTTISFSIPKAVIVELSIFNLNGEIIADLITAKLSQGAYKYEFDGSNLTSGIYFYRLRTNEYSKTKKLVLLK